MIGEIVKQGKLLLLGCCFSKPELTQVMFKVNQLDKFVIEVLLKSPIQKIREEMVDAICQLCIEIDPVKHK